MTSLPDTEGVVSPAAETSVEYWEEPTRNVPLTWGTYALRFWLGVTLGTLALIVAVVTNTVYVTFGPLHHAPALLLALAAILMLPSRPSSRYVAIGLIALAAVVWVLVVPSTLDAYGDWPDGVLFVWWPTVAGLLLAAWLTARGRAGKAWLVIVPFALFALFALFLESAAFSAFSLTDPVTLEMAYHFKTVRQMAPYAYLFLVPLAAWLAAVISRGRRPRAPRPSKQPRPVQQLSASQPSADAGTPALGPVTQSEWNGFAIAGFVLVLTAAAMVVGIVLAHIGLSQIRKTGQRGHGLAVAALVMGYVGLALGLIAFVAVIVVGFSSGIYGSF